MELLQRLGMTIPIVQAPMAGISTPTLAAAVSNAGALGSIAIGATDVGGAHAMIAEVRTRTTRPFNVNVFVHPRPTRDPARETAWLAALSPEFASLDAQPPTVLRTIYTGFADDPAMAAMLLECAPSVVSFHFGVPDPTLVAAFRDRGTSLLATATSPDEARTIERAGIDAVVAQGIEAGGHRGMFNPDAPDDGLGIAVLTRLLVRGGRLPVIAAGGIMDGAGIAAALDLGAIAAQLGTAFIACPESAADDAHRRALHGPGGRHTCLTAAISGRPARALANRFTTLGERLADRRPPDYPVAYDAGKALHAAAKARGEVGYGAHWAGQGAPLARAMPATELVTILRDELARLRA